MTVTATYEQKTPSFTVTIVEFPYDQVSLVEQYFLMLEIFGPKLLSYMIGAEELDSSDRATGSTSLLYFYNGRVKRLETLYKASHMILSVDSIHILRMWIIGQNSELDYNPPATKIRDGELNQVLAAADSYRNGGF